jgi:cell division protein FtsL
MFGININLVIYALIFVICSYGAYTIYNLISDSAKKDAVIEQQQQALENNKQVIDSMTNAAKIKDALIADRDKQLEELDSKLENLTNNLGTDSGDAAAPSLKELFRRLK